MIIQPNNFFFLRRPLMPVNKLFRFYQEAYEQPKLYEKEILKIFKQPEVAEALYLASPHLYQAMVNLINGDTKSDKEKIFQSLHKYFIRMTTRATPYGMFAGCTVGEFDSFSQIDFNQDRLFLRHSRLDMNYVSELVNSLLKRDYIKSAILFYPNTSLYKVDNNYRYIENAIVNKKREYALSSVKANEFLDAVLFYAKQGAKPSQLIEQLDLMEVPKNQARDYIYSLIDAQLLVSELEVTVTGEEFFHVMIKKLSQIPEATKEVEILSYIQKILQKQDHDIDKYLTIQKKINRHFAKTKSKDLIQTDLFYNTPKCTLSNNFAQKLTSEFKNLIPLARLDRDHNLENFRVKFYERYEESEVPLMQAIDNEVGIGYGSVTSAKADYLPLLENINFPANGNTISIDWSPLLKLKHKLYTHAITKGQQVIRISDDIIHDYKNETDLDPQISNSFFMFGSLLASSYEEIDKGNFQFSFNSVGGTSGVNLMARFCHGSHEIHSRVKQVMEAEKKQFPEAILAEIAHLPESRIGNIISRPSLREFEICYLAGLSDGKSVNIELEDLMVSVPRGREIILRSKKLNKRVIPRLTNAHNTALGLPVYKFLCNLAHQGLDYNFNWNWDFLSFQPFLPRVEYKHLILSRAVWNIKKDDFSFLKSRNINREGLLLLKEQLNIPRYVQIKDHDNELLIDFDSELSLQLLKDTLQKEGRIRLCEFLGEPENCFLKDAHGSFTNEIVIPFTTTNDSLNSERKASLQNDVVVKRHFMTGSEWLYVKIYLGTKSADQLLTNFILPFVKDLKEKMIIDKWFFLRFADPDYHIRLRFHNGHDKNFSQYILCKLNKELESHLQKDLVSKIQTDTYVRELERYGSSHISQIEEIFYADSLAVLELIDLLEGNEGEEYRWLIALRGVDALLNDFDYSLEDKVNLLDKLKVNFFKEFNGNKRLLHSLNDKYRVLSSKIESFMEIGNDHINEFTDVRSILQKRSNHIRPLLYEAVEKCEVKKGDLAASFIHMFLNRMFISSPRVQELVVYHFLFKYYNSSLARLKYSPSKTSKKEFVSYGA